MHSRGGRLRTIPHQTDAPLNCHFLNVSIGKEGRALITTDGSTTFAQQKSGIQIDRNVILIVAIKFN